MHPDELFTVNRGKLDALLLKASELAELLDHAEKWHGGLIGPDTLRKANELRLELSRWK